MVRTGVAAILQAALALQEAASDSSGPARLHFLTLGTDS